MKKLFHGTTKTGANNIRKNGVNLYVNKGLADFGHGFYLATEKAVAENRAISMARRDDDNPEVIAFTLDTEGLKVKSYNIGDEWKEQIYNQRVNGIDNLDYDVVIGPIADGKIKVLLNGVVSGNITKEDFMNQIVGPITKKKQITIKTEKGIEHLKEE